MNPVIGLDVAKGESQVQAVLDKKQPYKKSFKAAHTLEGLNSLLDFIKEVEDVSGGHPPIVLEQLDIITHQLCNISKRAGTTY